MTETVNSGDAAATSATSARDYLRGARTSNYKWWKPIIALIVGLPLFYGFMFASGRLIILIGRYLFPEHVDASIPLLNGGNVLQHPLALLLRLLPFVIAILALALVVRFIEGRKFGTLTSVKGRMRWGFVGRAFILASLIFLPLVLLLFLVSPPSVDLSQLIPQVIIILLLVPIQSATEEYLFRGWFPQSLASWKAPVWLALLISTAFFTFLHLQYGPIGWTSVGVMGLCMGWLAIRTGGLEAAIALHVANNYIAFGLSLFSQEALANEADLSWDATLIKAGMTVLFTVIADFWLRRVIIKREGREVMTGAFGGPVGNFGEKAAPVVSGPAVPTHGELSGAPSAPAGLTPEGVSRAWVSVGQNVNTSV